MTRSLAVDQDVQTLMVNLQEVQKVRKCKTRGKIVEEDRSPLL